MLYTIIVILLILWLLGFLGPNVIPGIPRTGNVVHVLLVIWSSSLFSVSWESCSSTFR